MVGSHGLVFVLVTSHSFCHTLLAFMDVDALLGLLCNPASVRQVHVVVGLFPHSDFPYPICKDIMHHVPEWLAGFSKQIYEKSMVLFTPPVKKC